MSIEKELTQATKVKRKPGEKDQPYFKRLIAAVQALPDDEWENLGTKAQKWVNAGADAVNEDEDVDPFPDAAPPERNGRGERERAPASDDRDERRRERPAREEAEDETEPGENEEEEVAGKRAQGKKGAAKTSARPKAATKKVGAQVAIKKAIIKNPKMTTEQIADKLDAAGVKATPSAISTIRSGTLQTLRLVQEIGMPKGEF